MSPLPPDIAKIRDELAEEHKLLTKDNGIESSNYHFKSGFNACAEIFLKREEEWKKDYLAIRHIFKTERDKLRARNDKLVEALRKIAVDKPRNSIDEAQDYIDIAEAALAANKEQG